MLRRNAPAVLAVALLLAVWQLVCTLGIVPAYMLPSPLQVAAAFVEDFPQLMQNSLITLQEAFACLIFGVLTGFVAA
ncbi:MAG: ABC transporter permease, partial [Clostridia bacterium]|nr:ABC transporter permease [Clostridia bacterium]